MQVSRCLPAPGVLATLAASVAVCAASAAWCGERWGECATWSAAAAHVTVGLVCLGAVCGSVVWLDRGFLREIRTAIRPKQD